MNDNDAIVNLNMKDAGEAMRDCISRYYFDQITTVTFFGKPIYMPPLTRWQRFRSNIRWKIEDFRIWLSKRIYDWSSYEDP